MEPIAGISGISERHVSFHQEHHDCDDMLPRHVQIGNKSYKFRGAHIGGHIDGRHGENSGTKRQK